MRRTRFQGDSRELDGVLLLMALNSHSGHEEQIDAYDSPTEYSHRGKCNISRVPEACLGKLHIGRTRGRKTANTDCPLGRAARHFRGNQTGILQKSKLTGSEWHVHSQDLKLKEARSQAPYRVWFLFLFCCFCLHFFKNFTYRYVCVPC